MWNFLEKASGKKQSFDEKLEKSSGYSMTKWFDNLSSSVKPICFAMAMATGAVACSQSAMAAEPANAAHMNLQQQIEVMENHTSNIASKDTLFQQASYMLDMTPDDLIALADQTKAPSASELPAITVQDLAEQIAANGGQVDIGGGVGLVNPYLTDQTVPVHENGNVSFYLKNVLSGDLPISGVSTYMSTNNAFALVGNYEMDSFLEQRAQTNIMLPELMSSSSNWMADAPAEQHIANTLYHELAHAHITQTLSVFGTTMDGAEANNAIDDSLMVEAHAILTGNMMTAKAYDIPVEDFRAFMQEDAAQRGEKMLLNMDGHDNYRPQKAYEVVDQILEANPNLLDELDSKEIPGFALEVVLQAGFYHGTADLLASTMDSMLPDQVETGADRADKQFLDIIASSYPDNPVLNEKVTELQNLWGDHKGAAVLDRLAQNIDVTLDGGMIPDGQKAQLIGSAEYLGEHFEGHQPELAKIANASAQAISSGEVSFADGMRQFSQVLHETVATAPTVDELNDQRTELLADIHAELLYQSTAEMIADPLSSRAIGVGNGANNIAGDLMERYNLNQFAELSEQHYASQSL